MDRYFLVFYIAIKADGDHVFGSSDCVTQDGKYPPAKGLTISIAQDLIPEIGELKNLVFTNIVELSQNDFIDWKRC